MKVVKIEKTNQLVFYCEGCGENHYTDSKWSFNGDYFNPTFSPSILVRGVQRVTDEEAERILNGERIKPKQFVCHSFVKNGEIQYLDDCTHSFAGKTIKLKDESGWYE